MRTRVRPSGDRLRVGVVELEDRRLVAGHPAGDYPYLVDLVARHDHAGARTRRRASVVVAECGTGAVFDLVGRFGEGAPVDDAARDHPERIPALAARVLAEHEPRAGMGRLAHPFDPPR